MRRRVDASSKTLLERLQAFLETRDGGQLRGAHIINRILPLPGAGLVVIEPQL
jgi:hypothetical protein